MSVLADQLKTTKATAKANGSNLDLEAFFRDKTNATLARQTSMGLLQTLMRTLRRAQQSIDLAEEAFQTENSFGLNADLRNATEKGTAHAVHLHKQALVEALQKSVDAGVTLGLVGNPPGTNGGLGVGAFGGNLNGPNAARVFDADLADKRISAFAHLRMWLKCLIDYLRHVHQCFESLDPADSTQIIRELTRTFFVKRVADRLSNLDTESGPGKTSNHKSGSDLKYLALLLASPYPGGDVVRLQSLTSIFAEHAWSGLVHKKMFGALYSVMPGAHPTAEIQANPFNTPARANPLSMFTLNFLKSREQAVWDIGTVVGEFAESYVGILNSEERFNQELVREFGARVGNSDGGLKKFLHKF